MTILCYHAVQRHWTSPLAVDPDVFATQMQWLARHRVALPLDRAVERLDAKGRLSRGSTVLTFDDGLQSVHRHAWPELRRHGLPAAVFLVAETLTSAGRAVDWIDTPPPYPLETLTLDEVRELQAAGISFASHSYSHLDLTTLSFEECVRDLRDSRALLEDLLGQRVPFLAYPRGRHNHAVRSAAAAAGYSHSFTLPEAFEEPGPHAVPRVGIFPGNGRAAMAVKLEPSYLALRMSRVFPALRRAAARFGAAPPGK